MIVVRFFDVREFLFLFICLVVKEKVSDNFLRIRRLKLRVSEFMNCCGLVIR